MPQPPFSGSQIQISQRNGANDPVYRRENAKIAGLKGGGFIAVWAQYITADTQAASTSIQAQIYNANGTKRGAEFKVNTSSSSNDLDVHSPDVTVLTNGQILIAYEQRLNPLFTDKSDIRTRIFQPDGTPASPMVDAFPVTFHGSR